MDFSQYLGGLPLHPLVVHFAVVLVPLSALFLILLVLIRGWADRFGWLIVISVAFGTLTSFVGAYISYFLDGATGGIIVTLQTLLFLLAFFFAPKHGRIAARRQRAAAVGAAP